MSNFELAAAMHLKTIEQQARIIAGLEPKVPEGYRLLPVVPSPAIRDALVESGRCFEPDSTWAAIIAAHDLAHLGSIGATKVEAAPAANLHGPQCVCDSCVNPLL